MNLRSVHWIRFVGGLLWLAFGLLWILQGAGIVAGSAMSGQRVWLVIGIVVAAVGLWLIRLGFSQRK